jgi:hypothetical protein
MSKTSVAAPPKVLTITSAMAAFFDGNCDDGESLLCQGIETDIHLMTNGDTSDLILDRIGSIYSRVIKTSVDIDELLEWADNECQSTYDSVIVYQRALKEARASGRQPRRAMWIDTVEIDDRYRGFDYSIQALSLLLTTFDIDMPFLQASPIERRQLVCEDGSKLKLSRHWGKLGLKKMPGTDWLYAAKWQPPAKYAPLMPD